MRREAAIASVSDPATGSGGNGVMEAGDLLTPREQPRPRRRLRLRTLSGELSGGNPLALLSWQPKKANEVWTRQEWTSLAEHLHNDNPPTHYVMGFCKEGKVHYVRSKRVPAGRAISWAWTSITGTARLRLAFAPYSSNERQQSRWGGLDFDAHDGDCDRARELAFAAFRVLLNVPDLCIVLETSGSGGWHVWAISPEFHSTADWLRLLKNVVRLIGATVCSGLCEIFPPDSLPSRFSIGMRAPGCWNPRSGTCSEIVWENTHTSLDSVLSGKSKTVALIPKGLEGDFPDKERSISFSIPLYRSKQFLQQLGITVPSTRNGRLGKLVGAVFHQVGHTTARGLAQEQFRGKAAPTKATEAEHLASFEKHWQGLSEKWAAKLSEVEREVFARLDTQNERDAFRIVRSFARKAESDGAADFPIVRDNLAARLGVTGNGAAGIRDKLARLGLIEKTADCVKNKFAARFKWLAGKVR
jgi:hypothetical protein